MADDPNGVERRVGTKKPARFELKNLKKEEISPSPKSKSGDGRGWRNVTIFSIRYRRSKRRGERRRQLEERERERAILSDAERERE